MREYDRGNAGDRREERIEREKSYWKNRNGIKREVKEGKRKWIQKDHLD